MQGRLEVRGPPVVGSALFVVVKTGIGGGPNDAGRLTEW